MKSESKLEAVLAGGNFAVTAECGPPKGSTPDELLHKGRLLAPCCDALNVTDNQAAVVRMSSLAGCVLLQPIGVEPVLQMVVRDRNRLALQSDILGAAALGIRNVLCLSGDHHSLGNHPQAKGVYDIDSMHLLSMVRAMRDQHRFMNGEPIKGEVSLFIGAAANPAADPYELRVARLAKKVKAGADFVQTQAVFDLPRFLDWMKRVRDQGLHERVHILAGVLPIKSAHMARHLQEHLSGLRVPDDMVTRMAGAKNAPVEGVRICLELIEQLKQTEGVHGIHIMAVAWEEIVPRIVEAAGLLPRPPSR